MKFLFFYFIFILFLSTTEVQKAENIYWPMKLRLPISGTFAEFRNSHLHMGCDYKTYGINGFPIVSVFDGYVSSLSYSETGYGLSVNLISNQYNLQAKYAHLNDLRMAVPELDNLKIALQLLNGNKSFGVKLESNQFKVKGNQEIAHSGETGSGVSHLHLELFDSKEYLNPLSFKNFIQKDLFPPTLQTLFIDSNNGFSKKINLINSGNGIFKFAEEPRLSGKVKFKIAAYDRISSKNHNNIFAISMKINGQNTFEKNFSKMGYKQAAEKDAIYDINKSSLSPPYYVYNIFNKDSFSLDLDEFENEKLVRVEIQFYDASENISTLDFFISKVKSSKQSLTNLEKKFSSEDQVIKLDLSKLNIIGEGSLQIQKVKDLPTNSKIQNLEIVSDAYQITANDYSWKGSIEGIWETKLTKKNQSLYLFDAILNYWTPVTVKKNANSIAFSFSRLGILAILEDNSPPSIYYPYLIYRHYNLPEIQDPNMIERFYAVSDKGAGISSSFEVLLEGKSYPYTFDRDRNFVKIEIPKIILNEKKFLFIQVRAHDFAGNYSEWFSDIVSFQK